ncbi:hypothetical protein [Paraburkholderia heleia]|uniref:hypothetical protein n=1 Tax=Paraburkholderia heleia TaxID=634127 RepID=UPI002AB705FC|nr:hypothetical protein [Paraburkholderia heleia]
MKATINARGSLIVEPENELEAYALGKWSAKNLHDWYSALPTMQLNVMVNLERWPDALEPMPAIGVRRP